MIKNILIAAIFSVGAMISTASANTTDVAHGKISKLVPSKKEIYIKTDKGKNEYYFSDKTTVESNGKSLSYSDLKEGMDVTVTANKVGKRLEPLKVEITEESGVAH